MVRRESEASQIGWEDYRLESETPAQTNRSLARRDMDKDEPLELCIWKMNEHMLARLDEHGEELRFLKQIEDEPGSGNLPKA